MKHLSVEQRYEISALLRAHHKKSDIAKLLGVHKSTITREIKRNNYMDLNLYVARYAQSKAESRARLRSSNYKKSVAQSVFDKARELIVEHQYSPEQVVGYCRRMGIRMCSHETLYKWIWRDKRKGGKVYLYLRHRGRKYRSREAVNNSRRYLPGAVDISQRPFEVEDRRRFGDFEIDTIIGMNMSQHIITIVDRMTGLLLMKRLKEPTSKETARALLELMKPLYKSGHVHTITSDNGRQFAKHRLISRITGSSFFFARPYHSWERGTNENTNGLIRQYIPKKANFDMYTDQDIFEIQMKINNRPRKRLGFLSPIEKLYLTTKIDQKVAFGA